MSERQPHPPDRDPDHDVVEACRAGDGGAFDELVRRHQDRIYRLACRILSDAEDALDAAQETFVKAWRAIDRFQGDARFSTWLTRIAINQCRNELRRRGTVKHTRPASLDVPVGSSGTPRVARLEGPGPAPWQQLQGREVDAALQEAMGQLEPEAREVLVLREVESMGYEEMARLLDVPVGTVRSRLHRARARLREHMTRVLDT